MRLAKQEQEVLKKAILDCLPTAKIYLFGSRVDNTRKGGDIDILVIGSRTLNFAEKAKIRFKFEAEFGQQKVDIVSSTEDDNSPFKLLALEGSVML